MDNITINLPQEHTEQFVYLVQKKKYLEENQPIYKIGKTKNWKSRILTAYPNGRVLCLENVYNCDTMETKLIAIFKEQFVHRKEIGFEYFTGDINAMRITLLNEVIKETLSIQNRANKYAMLKSAREFEQNNDSNACKETELITLSTDTPYVEKDNIEDVNDDSVDTIVDVTRDDRQSLSITTKVVLSNSSSEKDNRDKDNMDEFIKHVCETMPDWYKEQHSVDIKIIRDAYNKLFNSNVTSSVISRYLQGKMFKTGLRCNGMTTKKLVSYRELRKHIPD